MEVVFTNQHSLFGGGLALAHGAKGAGIEIVASVQHYRSPTVVARLNGRGELLGEYRHFGHLYSPQTVSSSAVSGDLVVLIGSNDVDSTSGGEFPVIVVLDPSKISGRSEATTTRGFGFPSSMAEVVYIRIPYSDMDNAVDAVIDVVRPMAAGGKRWSFLVAGSESTSGSCFEYVFDQTWRVESVLSTDANARIRAKMLDKGLVHGQIDQRYLNALKNSVEYWDGQEWKREFCLVHSAPSRN